MRIYFLILFVSTLFITTSCEKGKPEPDNNSKTSFIIANNSYVSTTTNLYITEFGKIVETYSDDFQLIIVLSDKSGTIFNITDTLKAENENVARSILKIENDYHFSFSGTIDLDSDNKSGIMEILFENINLNEGKLFIDSVITKPYIDFTKITSTNSQGEPTNNGDENDWIIRNDFQLVERLLFNENSVFSYKDIELIEYPNPLNDIIQLQIDNSQIEYVDFFLVNENFEIEQEFIQLQSGNYAFLLDNPDYNGNYYRLYYKIYSDNEIYYGSGDLKVEE